MTARRWLAVCGIAAAVLFAVGTGISGGSPQDDASASKVVSYYRDHLTGTRVGALILVIAAVLLVLFAARLRELLRNGQPGGDVFPIAAFGGAVLLAAGSCLDAAVSFALAQAGDNKFAGAAQTLNVVSNNDFFLVIGGIATLLLATGISTVRRPVLPRWLGWAAVVIGIISLGGPAGFIGAVLAILWLLVVSILMFVRTDLLAVGAAGDGV
mgnify:CR=1 FL=1